MVLLDQVCPLLTTSQPEPAPKRSSWAAPIAERYAVRLSEDLVDWFDGGIWERAGTGEFCDPVTPEQLLSPHPEAIWPGFMLPDTIPLLGNRYGDWLCMRVGADSRVREIIHWYHGGGDWIPWGATLAEAIAFDRLRHDLPGHRQVYAEAAEALRRSPNEAPLHQWAGDHLPAEIRAAIRAHQPNETAQLTESLLESGVCEVAVHCELALHALDNSLRRRLTSEIARELQIPWREEAVRWMFDPREMPESARARLAKRLRLRDDEIVHQDWQAAIAHASAVTAVRSDLGWALDLCGWEAERDGRFGEAGRYYQRALSASAFADQTIRFRTHWCADAKGKFAAARLQAMLTSNRSSWAEDDLADASRRYLRRLLETPRDQRATAVTDYWIERADGAVQRSDWALEYDLLYLAGWDLGADSMSTYRVLLQRMIPAAEKSGQAARAAVARAHLACLDARFA